MIFNDVYIKFMTELTTKNKILYFISLFCFANNNYYLIPMSLLTNKNANIESSNKKYYAYLLLIQLLMLTALTVSVPSVVGF